MKKIYISIPISGKDYQEQKSIAEKKAKELRGEGHWVVTPFELVNENDPRQNDYAYCMGRCVEALLKCDRIMLMDGWVESKGCTAEYLISFNYGLEITENDNGGGGTKRPRLLEPRPKRDGNVKRCQCKDRDFFFVKQQIVK